MSATIFVGNLNYKTTEQQLRRFFAEAGDLRAVTLPVDRESGRPRGFAFVEFETELQAEMAATVFDGRILGGRPLRVKVADARPPRHSRSGPESARRRPPRLEKEEDDEFAVPPQEGRGMRRGEREWRQMRRTKRSL